MTLWEMLKEYYTKGAETRASADVEQERLMHDSQARQNMFDAVALATSPVPLLGDTMGAVSDMHRYAQFPEERTLLNYGLTGLGLLPFIPSMLSIKGATKAALKKPAKAIGTIDWEGMAPLVRQQFALKGGHLKAAKNGTYIGAPPGVGPENIEQLRRRLYKELRGVMEKPWATNYMAWYDRQRAGVDAVTNSPEQAHALAHGIGIYSPQATPPVNYTRAANQAGHYTATGDIMSKPGTRSQMRKFAEAMQGGEPKHGRKTGAFFRSSDPTSADPDMATNDIWVGRFAGYRNTHPKKIDKPFDRGLQASEHSFIQGELQRMTAIANREGWGGRKNWHIEELQALPWVEYKANSLVAKRKLPYEKAIDEAMHTTLESLPRNTAFLMSETTPFSGSRHLPGLTEAGYDERLAHTMAPGNFMGPDKRNILYQSLEFPLEQEARLAEGVYTHPVTQNVENNPVIGFRPNVERIAGGDVSDASRQALENISLTQSLFNVQGATPWSMFIPQGSGMRVGDMNAVGLLSPHPLTFDQLGQARASSPWVGQWGGAIDYGGGEGMLTTWGAAPRIGKTSSKFGPVQPKAGMGEKAQKEIVENIKKVVPGVQATPGKVVSSDYDAISLEDAWKNPEGTGAATMKWAEHLNKNPQQAEYMLGRWQNNPDVGRELLEMNKRDMDWAMPRNDPFRKDVIRLREDAAREGLLDFWKKILREGAQGYPVLIPGAVGGGLLMMGEEDERRYY